MSRLDASLVVPLYNGVEFTRRCVETIRAAATAATYEIVLVDNGSSDATGALLDELGDSVVAIRNAENLGFSRACNQGAAAATGRHLVFVNYDVEASDGWLDALVGVLDREPDAGVVGARLLFPDGTIQHAGVVLAADEATGHLLPYHRLYHWPADHPRAVVREDVAIVTGAVMAVRRDVFTAVGGFEEGYWNGYEDVDLCLAARSLGWRVVYEPAATLVHHESVSGPERFSKNRANDVLLQRRWRGKVAPDVLVAADGTMRPAGEPAAPAPSGLDPALTSIVILTHGQLALTRACLLSIERHTPEPHEVIVVDNGSPDRTPQFLESYARETPHVQVVLNRENRGFAAASNQGLALARGGTVCLLNNDTVVTAGWLGRMRAVLDREPAVGLVGPVSNSVSGRQQLAEPPTREDADACAARLAREHAGESEAVLRLVGFCLLARREVIEAVGGLDERFGSGNFEDDDLCLRARAAGFEARIARDAFVWHEGSATFAGAGIDHQRAMLGNWALFKQLWDLPADLPLDGGYALDPDALAPRAVPLPTPALTHACTGRVWREAAHAAPDAALAAVAGEQARLQAAFAELAGWRDRDRAYAALRRLVTSVLAASHEDRALLAAAADGLLEALEREPAEPVLLNEAGVLLYGLGEGGAARQLFTAARRLDPALPRVGENLADARALERAGRRRRALPTGGLAARAAKVAHRARPATGLTISLCMIVKDEEELLPGCLASARPVVDEIVVVDTGSTDRTVAIAESFGARVVPFPWTGSFAEARNVSLDHACGDWILWLDADEHLVPEDAPLLRELAGRTWREGFYLPMTNLVGDGEGELAFTHLTMRLFRNRPHYRFEGRVHEQHTNAMPLGIPERFERVDVRVLHHGYRDDRIAARDKRRRNIELLRQEEPGAFTSFNLGTEYLAEGDTARATPLLEEAWRAVSVERARAGGPLPQYVPALALRLVQAKRLAGDHEGALAAAAEVLAVYPDHTDVVREAALAARAAGDLDGAAALAERCLEQGDAPARYAGAVGAGGALALSLLAEIRVEQGRVAEAEELLERSLAEHPEATGARARLDELRAGGAARRLLDVALAGDADGLAEALGTARLAGTPAEELEVYRAWLAVLAGGAPEALQAECAVPLTAVLDELLRREEFEAFEAVLRIWEKVDVPPRERREVLARIYLGRGFLDSAAEEWLAVAQGGADARAYAGLARVAAARGLSADAAELAREAARLDPGNGDARAVLEWARREASERVHAA